VRRSTEEPLASRCVVNGNVGARHAMGGADLPRVAVGWFIFFLVCSFSDPTSGLGVPLVWSYRPQMSDGMDNELCLCLESIFT
jgi:hypothetical protein